MRRNVVFCKNVLWYILAKNAGAYGKLVWSELIVVLRHVFLAGNGRDFLIKKRLMVHFAESENWGFAWQNAAGSN